MSIKYSPLKPCSANRRLYQYSGFALLEFSIAAALILPLILGALSIYETLYLNSVLQSEINRVLSSQIIVAHNNSEEIDLNTILQEVNDSIQSRIGENKLKIVIGDFEITSVSNTLNKSFKSRVIGCDDIGLFKCSADSQIKSRLVKYAKQYYDNHPDLFYIREFDHLNESYLVNVGNNHILAVVGEVELPFNKFLKFKIADNIEYFNLILPRRQVW